MERPKGHISSKQKGAIAEEAAVQYLKGKGFSVIDHNVSRAYGEVDIVAEREGVVHFVEVKSDWTGTRSGWRPEDKVDTRKIAHIANVATSYMEQNRGTDLPWCIDVLVLRLDAQSCRAVEVEHLENVTL